MEDILLLDLRNINDRSDDSDSQITEVLILG